MSELTISTLLRAVICVLGCLPGPSGESSGGPFLAINGVFGMTVCSASGAMTSSTFKGRPVGAVGGPASSKLLSNEAIGAGPIRFVLLDFVVIDEILTTNKLAASYFAS